MTEAKNGKCPTCGGVMWMDYESDMTGKSYFWKCSKKKKHNPLCPDRNKYFECYKHDKILCSECKPLVEHKSVEVIDAK